MVILDGDFPKCWRRVYYSVRGDKQVQTLVTVNGSKRPIDLSNGEELLKHEEQPQNLRPSSYGCPACEGLGTYYGVECSMCKGGGAAKC